MRHASRFTPDNGTERQGPDSGYALDLLWSISTGITVRIDKRWTAGLVMSGVGVAQSLNSNTLQGAFEGGLFMGYGWSP